LLIWQPEVKIRLFRSYCTSFYGCELWNLPCAQLADLCTKWRKSVRRVLNLPLQTHLFAFFVASMPSWLR